MMSEAWPGKFCTANAPRLNAEADYFKLKKHPPKKKIGRYLCGIKFVSSTKYTFYSSAI